MDSGSLRSLECTAQGCHCFSKGLSSGGCLDGGWPWAGPPESTSLPGGLPMFFLWGSNTIPGSAPHLISQWLPGCSQLFSHSKQESRNVYSASKPPCQVWKVKACFWEEWCCLRKEAFTGKQQQMRVSQTPVCTSFSKQWVRWRTRNFSHLQGAVLTAPSLLPCTF